MNIDRWVGFIDKDFRSSLYLIFWERGPSFFYSEIVAKILIDMFVYATLYTTDALTTHHTTPHIWSEEASQNLLK